MILGSVNPFSLRDLAFSHGWIALPPWSWQTDPPSLRRVERLPSGAIVSLQITSAESHVPTENFHVSLPERRGPQLLSSGSNPAAESLPECGHSPLRRALDQTQATDDADFSRNPVALSAQDRSVVEQRLRWMLRLDEDLTEFHTLMSSVHGCERPASRGEGRLLRSWDFFEDAIKTICTTNTTWAQTRSMAAQLVECYGEAGEEGTAFPEPGCLAAASEAELRGLGLGYRAAAARALATGVAAGDLPREAAAWAAFPSDELQQRLLALRGIGPYAAANLRMLLGHYDRLAIDSWVRRAVREAWFDGTPVSDREIERRFDEFGPWRALVYWFHPALHPGRDAWREKAGEGA